jgi:hypothetical protein
VRTGIISLADALVGGAAGADASQQDQFLALLQQMQIPAIDNVPGLVYHAHEICGELDGGASVETVVTDVMNRAYEDNPSLHSLPARVRKTAVRFVTASVDVYCPSHQGELPVAP